MRSWCRRGRPVLGLQRPLHWRQNELISGRNVLSLGILLETLMRWTPAVQQVFAQGAVVEPTRPVPEESRFAECTIPDNLQVVAKLEQNVRAIYHMSGVAMFGPGKQIHLYGSRGTMRVYFGERERVMIGHAGEDAMHEAEIPPELLRDAGGSKRNSSARFAEPSR